MSFINPTLEFKRHELGDHMYLGVVEINEDPLSLGRARIRVPEVHGTLSKKEQLPWATPLRALYRGGSQNNGYYSRPDVDSRVALFFHRGSVYSPIYYAEPRSKAEGLKNLEPSDAGFDSILGEYFKITESGTVRFQHRSGSYIEISPSGGFRMHLEGEVDVDAPDYDWRLNG